MKIATLNLAGYKEWSDRQSLVVDSINQNRPDILCLQEAMFDMSVSVYSQPAYINQLLNTPYQCSAVSISKFYRPSKGEPFREGLAVLADYEITRSETLVLHQVLDDKHVRFCQLVDMKCGNQEVKLANVHFSNNKYSISQLKEVLDILSGRQEERLIVGDFNILNPETVKEVLQEGGYTLAYDFSPYVSFESDNLTLDHIAVPRNYTIEEVKIVSGLSDHSAVVVRLGGADVELELA